MGDGGMGALILLGGVVVALFIFTAIIATTFLRSVGRGRDFAGFVAGSQGAADISGAEKSVCRADFYAGSFDTRAGDQRRY